MLDIRKVYLDAGTKEQFDAVVEEVSGDPMYDTDCLDFVFLTDISDISHFPAEVWRCRDLDRSLSNFNVVYQEM